jgi:hypothetical protein
MASTAETCPMLSDSPRLSDIKSEKLAASQFQRPQRFVVAARHHPRRPLYVQAHARVANLMRDSNGQFVAV